MAKRWTEEDIEILKEEIALGTTHTDIAEILDKSTKAVQLKAHRLGIKKWSEKDIKILKEQMELGSTQQKISILLNKSLKAIQNKAARLDLKSKNRKILKTNEQYDAELKIKNPDIIRIEDYKGRDIKILHKCIICNTEHLCSPDGKLQGKKHCNYKDNQGNGIPSNKPGITYLVHFPNENLYKVGITSRTVKQRMGGIGAKEYEIILERHFGKGLDAMALEKEWLENIKHLKVNTGLLNDGNTETFKC